MIAFLFGIGISIDLQTNHQSLTYREHPESIFLHRPIHQNQSFGIFYCKMDEMGFQHSKQQQTDMLDI